MHLCCFGLNLVLVGYLGLKSRNKRLWASTNTVASIPAGLRLRNYINNTFRCRVYRVATRVNVGVIVCYLLGSSPHTQYCPIRFLARAGYPPRDALLACTERRGSGSEGHKLQGTGQLQWRAAPSRRPLPGSPWVLHSPLRPLLCTLRPCSRKENTELESKLRCRQGLTG